MISRHVSSLLLDSYVNLIVGCIELIFFYVFFELFLGICPYQENVINVSFLYVDMFIC